MKISYNWLKEFIDLKKYSAAKLADLLTMNFAEVDGIETVGNDAIFDLKILPDRMPDCLSHYGVAREIGALAKLKVKPPAGGLKFKVKESKKEKIDNILKVENQNPEICRRYVSRVIKNIKIGPSPKWLAERLESLGQKSINNVVDATNYAMLELGQPLHAFDLEKVKGVEIRNPKSEILNKFQISNSKSQIPKIIIRKAHKGEKITTLDNQDVELSENILVIANEKGALAIAGVKGGKRAEIDQNTKNIVLESANFTAQSVRKSSRLTGIKTESSIRFAADLDPNLAGQAMERLASIIIDIAMPAGRHGLPAGRQAGGEVAGGRIDIYPRPVKEYRIGFSLEDVNKLLGTELAEKEVVDILKRLNFKVKKVSPLKEILKLAKVFIGAEYKYGASVSFDAPRVFDCSSLTNYIFTQAGIQIPRISVDQYFYGEPVAEKDAVPGDLVFSNSGRGKIYYESKEFLKGTKIKEGIDHVGLYLGGGKVIHAALGEGGVVVENLKKSKSFKNFRGFRRMIKGSTLGIQKVEPQEIFVVDVPTYRRDIGPKGTFVLQKADIIEEIGRLYGYQNLKSKLPEGVLIPAERNDELHWENMAKNALISAGFAEVYNYSFIGKKDLETVSCHPDSGRHPELDSHPERSEGSLCDILQLANYPSDERRYLRPSLLFGLLKNIKDNFRFFKEVRMFELGKIFLTTSSENVIARDEAMPTGRQAISREKKYLSGSVGYKSGYGKGAGEFYEIKSAVDLLIRKLGIPEVWYDNYDSGSHPESASRRTKDLRDSSVAPLPQNDNINNVFHPLRLAEIKIGDEKIGFIGEINPKVLDAYEIESRVAVFEIDFDKLAKIAEEDYIYRPTSKYPAVERDLAILVPLDIKVDDVLNVLENVGRELLVDTDLFDIYEGDNIAEGMKSLAFHLIFQSQNRTLSDKEIDDIMLKIITALGDQGWEIRK